MRTRKFWTDALERAARAAANAALGVLGVGATGLLDVDWAAAGSVSGLAALVSLLLSVGGSAAQFGDRDAAGLVSLRK